MSCDSVRVDLHHGVGSLDINPVVDPHDVVPRLGGVALAVPPGTHRLVEVGAVGDGEPHCLQVVDGPPSTDWGSDQHLNTITYLAQALFYHLHLHHLHLHHLHLLTFKG